MKKLLVCLMVGFLGMGFCVSKCSAEVKLPPLKQGIAWSLADSKLNYLSTIEVLTWKGLNLEVGYAGRAENTGDKAVAVVSYEIAKLKDFGVTVPILDLIEFNFGAYAGYGRIENINSLDDSEFDYGLSATILNLKF